MAQRKSTVDEAYPGDIVGLPDNGIFKIGDTLTEGELQWVQKTEVQKLPIWEGDKLFFRLLEEEHPYFSLKLVYDGDTLKQAVLDGKRIV